MRKNDRDRRLSLMCRNAIIAGDNRDLKVYRARVKGLWNKLSMIFEIFPARNNRPKVTIRANCESAPHRAERFISICIYRTNGSADLCTEANSSKKDGLRANVRKIDR